MGETVNTFAQNSKKWAWVWAGIGLATVGLSTIYVLNQRNNQPSTTNTPREQKAEIKAVTALGRIEPQGEVIQLAPTPNLGGAKVTELLVKEGDKVQLGQVIAVLDNHKTKKAELAKAAKEIQVAQANLAIVKAGAKQGEIDAQKATIARIKAQLQGEMATNQAKIARLEAQLASEQEEKLATIQRFKAELANAQIEWQRYENLAADGAISQSDLDQKRLVLDTATERYDEAKASYQKTVTTLSEEIREAQAFTSQTVNTLQQEIIEAEAQLDRIAEVRDVDVFQAEAEVERAIALYKQIENELELTDIKAPIKGQIIKIKAYPGENIDPNEGVVELGNTEQMIVVAEVYESDIKKVKVNQEVIIQSENGAFNGEIKGKVIDVGRQIGKKDVLDTDPAADVDARVVEVKVAINREDNDKIANLIYSKVLVKILL
jgi:HlyD family secretion protein